MLVDLSSPAVRSRLPPGPCSRPSARTIRENWRAAARPLPACRSGTCSSQRAATLVRHDTISLCDDDLHNCTAQPDRRTTS
jgi:hypothetical protein